MRDHGEGAGRLPEGAWRHPPAVRTAPARAPGRRGPATCSRQHRKLQDARDSQETLSITPARRSTPHSALSTTTTLTTPSSATDTSRLLESQPRLIPYGFDQPGLISTWLYSIRRVRHATSTTKGLDQPRPLTVRGGQARYVRDASGGSVNASSVVVTGENASPTHLSARRGERGENAAELCSHGPWANRNHALRNTNSPP